MCFQLRHRYILVYFEYYPVISIHNTFENGQIGGGGGGSVSNRPQREGINRLNEHTHVVT